MKKISALAIAGLVAGMQVDTVRRYNEKPASSYGGWKRLRWPDNRKKPAGTKLARKAKKGKLGLSTIK